jgi:glutamate N-acetyltransferase/amino-acid N-acetyltransferase
MISVDGDTSTNDMAAILANGLAGNQEITEENEDFYKFKQALNMVTAALSRMIAADGEGATKLLECKVSGAKTQSDARKAAKAVVDSSLLKAAMFGSDPNWGRIMSALGSSGADIDVNKVDVAFKSSPGQVVVCRDGFAVLYPEELARKILEQDHIQILVELKDGVFSATAFGCDLTYDYIKINGEYTT